jgi:hypothetical protein
VSCWYLSVRVVDRHQALIDLRYILSKEPDLLPEPGRVVLLAKRVGRRAKGEHLAQACVERPARLLILRR